MKLIKDLPQKACNLDSEDLKKSMQWLIEHKSKEQLISMVSGTLQSIMQKAAIYAEFE